LGRSIGGLLLLALDAAVVKEHLLRLVADHRSRVRARRHLAEQVVPGLAKTMNDEPFGNAGCLESSAEGLP
jgi:hypothetical protein